MMSTFVQVYKKGSFSVAAAQLGMSPAVVTKHIAKLEQSLGARLFNRTIRMVRPTDAGMKYFDFCNKTLNDIEEAEADVATAQSAPRGSLRISVPKAFGSLYAGAAIADFVARHPQISIAAFTNDAPLDPKSMMEMGYDLAICPSRPSDTSIVARQVCKLPWIACAAPRFVATAPAIRAPADLAHINCLLHTGIHADGYWRFNSRKGKTKIKVEGNMGSNSFMVLKSAALAGAGVALLPLYCVADEIAEGKLVRVLAQHEGPATDLFVLFPYRSHMPHRLRLLIDFIAERFRNAGWNRL